MLPLLGLLTAATILHAQPQQQVLFPADTAHTAACYRIPALVTAPNGDLLAAVDERIPSCADLKDNRDIDIVLRRSTNNGRTWSGIERVVDFPQGLSASDPSFIADTASGKVWLFYNFMHHDSAPGQFRMHVIHSKDNGRSWSDPRDITPHITKPEWSRDFQFITSGRGTQTPSGMLLHTLVNLSHGLYVFSSADQGQSWFLLDVPIQPANESKILALTDQHWLINSRVQGAGLRYVHTTTNGGQSWQSQPDSVLVDPACNASFIQYPADKQAADTTYLLFSNVQHASERKRLGVRMSRNGGRTWPVNRIIAPGSAAYSSLTVMANSYLGLLYERNQYQEIVFARFSLKWLKDGGEED